MVTNPATDDPSAVDPPPDLSSGLPPDLPSGRPSDATGGRRNLLADCQNCFALCCVALPFARSADFAIDKKGGTPCPNLAPDFRCGIHNRLRPTGFVGCTVYDCFGAGQQVSQVTFGAADWRSSPTIATQMFEVFPVMRDLHELLWYLRESLELRSAVQLHPALKNAVRDTERLTDSDPAVLLALDVDVHRRRVGALLVQVSELVRAQAVGKEGSKHRTDLVGADLMGAKLARADLRGADLRGAYLIGADLRRADLRLASLIGADLRAAELHGADLSSSLFLTQFQLNAAKGDGMTVVPDSLSRPAHWSTRSD